METLFTNKRFIRFSTVFMGLLCFMLVIGIVGKVRGGDRHYKGDSQNVIAFSGHGEVSAVPDIASIYFTVESSKATQVESSDEVNTKVASILEFLETSGIEEKDIKTEGYNSYPKYSNTNCYYGDVYYPCRNDQKIVGYTVSQSVTVKIRKIDDTSKVIDGINKIGVTNMSGPNMEIEKKDEFIAEARQMAIDDAKEKAKVLAKQLGVRLGKISSFSEGDDYPIMYAKAEMATMDAGAPAPSVIPKGENLITSDVTITYEIR